MFTQACVVSLLLVGLAAMALAADVSTLRCEYRADPLGIDTAQPRLSWIVNSDQRGTRQAAYQILVASTADLLASDKADLWDSGKIASDTSIQVRYAGQPLASGQQYFWKVRAWDEQDKPTAWSQPATWAMGLLNPPDWTGTWIGSGGPDGPISNDVGVLGYHAAEATKIDDEKWVQVDLGQSTKITSVNLHSMNHEVPGFGFPVRFKIEASDDPKFATATTIIDHTGSDYANPGHTRVVFDGKGASGRYVRVTATKLFQRAAGTKMFCFALAELEVIVGDRNAARQSGVTAKDSAEFSGWARNHLTDGKLRFLAPGEIEPVTERPLVKSLPVFRKSFNIDKPVKRAMIYVSGVGHYELRLNGQRVGESVLDPGWSDYRDTCLYVTYDITNALKPGEQVLGVLLGNGMYNVPRTPGRYNKFDGSMGPLQVIAQLVVSYADGTTQTVATDESWKVTGGPITFSNVFGGEDYDARLEQAGWDQAGFDDSKWLPALRYKGPGGKLAGLSKSAPPIHVAQVLKTQKVTNPKPGVWVYDLGQNCSLLPSLTISGSAGASVRMTLGEVLRDDGTVSQQPSGGPSYFVYTLKGSGREAWSPRFTYYGSRFIQIDGAVPSDQPNPSGLPVVYEVSGNFVTSSAPPAGEFSCSNPLFTRTAEIIRWAMRSNMVSVLTDCPHREKLGWLEQTHLVGPSLMYNFSIPAMYSKTCSDMADSQTVEGLIPDIAPEYPVFGGGFRDSPEWGSAVVLIPWQLYEWYGDASVLSLHYETMQRYVAYLGTKARNHIVSHGLGDWYDIGPKEPGPSQNTPQKLTATAFYYRDIVLLEKIATLLGKSEDAAKYAALGMEVRAAFNANMYNAEKKSYGTGSQASNAIPLEFGLAPEADRAAIVENIVQDVRNRGNSLTAGDVGYRYLLRALADGRRSDVIFDMNSRSDKPGYGMIIASGATALTEAWDGRKASSQNHFMLGHLMEWLYSDLAGIQYEPDAIAYKKIVIKPTPVGDITSARASYDSINGKIVSDWKIEGSKLTLDVTIPVGSTATVELPAPFNGEVAEAGKPVREATGVEVLAVEGGAQVAKYRIGSGTYRFQSIAAPTGG